jgi:hypothetical protein
MFFKSRSPNCFVADGCERAYRAVEKAVRASVEKEFAAERQAAPPAERLQIERRMREEIERRIDRLAPPDALY